MKATIFPALAICLLASSTHADVRLPSIFSDHMVLQRSQATRVWGSAEPGEQVTVSLGVQCATATAGADGKWRVSLNLKDEAATPMSMTVKGKNTVTLTDVLVGEVWLASGQSNMQMALRDTQDAQREIAQSANPRLREFLVKRSAVAAPAENCEGKWTVAEPKTSGGFSAVGYYFGKHLNHELQVPVGIINSSWGGTPVESWTSAQALESSPELAEGCKRAFQQHAAYPEKLAAYRRDFPLWLKSTGREDHPATAPEPLASENADLKDWVSVHIPGPISAPTLPASGAVWIRREVLLPPGSAGKPLTLALEVIQGFESVYWNGKKTGETTPLTLPGANARRSLEAAYTIPGNLVKDGVNTLALRIFAPDRPPALSGYGPGLKAGPVFLEGPWLAKMEYALPPLQAGAPQAPKAPDVMQAPQFMPAHLFNGMIYPILSYNIKGTLWYQGETNTGRAWQYRTALPLMIADWRSRWNLGDFPFYLCQLANYQAKKPLPVESAWAELREAQSTALALPKTGQAILLDTGEAGDIHPQNKNTVGERLAKIALANDYGKAIPCSGPVYTGMNIESGKIRLTFTHTEGGLVAKPLPATYDVCTRKAETAPLIRNSPKSPLEGFAICGSDRKWVWADAKIDGESVVVWSENVPVPTAVRYAWAENPTCNLYNGASLPAAPFRTDDFPASTLNAKY